MVTQQELIDHSEPFTCCFGEEKSVFLNSRLTAFTFA